jgi:hypothetical protein
MPVIMKNFYEVVVYFLVRQRILKSTFGYTIEQWEVRRCVFVAGGLPEDCLEHDSLAG